MIQDIIPCITLPHLSRQVSSCWIKSTGICLSLSWISYKTWSKNIALPSKAKKLLHALLVLGSYSTVHCLTIYCFPSTDVWSVTINRTDSDWLFQNCLQAVYIALSSVYTVFFFFFSALFLYSVVAKSDLFSLNIFSIKPFQKDNQSSFLKYLAVVV